jgi:hypothetical protein
MNYEPFGEANLKNHQDDIPSRLYSVQGGLSL